MAWKAAIVFESGYTQELEDVFSTEEEAQEAAEQWASDYGQGNEYLELAGEDHSDDEVAYFDTWEE